MFRSHTIYIYLQCISLINNATHRVFWVYLSLQVGETETKRQGKQEKGRAAQSYVAYIMQKVTSLPSVLLSLKSTVFARNLCKHRTLTVLLCICVCVCVCENNLILPLFWLKLIVNVRIGLDCGKCSNERVARTKSWM